MKKHLPKLTMLLGLLLVLVLYDNLSLRKINKPPAPEVTVGGKKVEAYPKEYIKDEEVTIISYKKPKEQTSTVNPRTKINVSFKDKPETVRITETMPDFVEEVINREVNNRIGKRTFLIKAMWEDEKEATYEIHVNVKETVTYQELLGQSEGDLNLLVISPEADTEEFNYIEFPFNHSSRYVTLEQAKLDYPELKLDSKTLYILFDYRKEVYRSDNLKEFTTFLKSYEQ
ncbi:hypothetical protein [Bacillus sp. CECT 9360]|uniref:hypothetical protein n=1 Tax=Bacillus sp. CECT 9360 TaxID=2845821 RepID=UPI001E4F8BD8|nr:hypothetical protein [Bacillus sp. CECT 9360]CAH0346671.1 hypothetical protein BCI9360_03016 [Bacillus sp. CECT 9360]